MPSWCPTCGTPGKPEFGGYCGRKCRRDSDDYHYHCAMFAEQEYERKKWDRDAAAVRKKACAPI